MDLTNAKIGDMFMLPQSIGFSRSTYYYKKVYVERITPKQVIIGGNAYWKKDGSLVAKRDEWGLSIKPFDADLYESGRRAVRLQKVKDYNRWHELPQESIDIIYKLININRLEVV